MEADLREKEAHLRGGTTYLPGIAFQRVLSLDGTLSVPYVSERAPEIFGYSAQELMAEPALFRAHFHPDDQERFRTVVLDSANTNQPAECECRFTTRTGELRWAHSVSLPRRMENGDTVWDGITLDITAQKQTHAALRESEQRYRNLVEGMNEGLVVADANQNITYVNDKFCEIVGRERQELLGRTTTHLYDDDSRAIRLRQLAARHRGEESPYEIVYTRKDDGRVHAYVSPRALFDAEGHYLGAFGIVTDLTELIEAQRRAREHQANLAHVLRLGTMDEMASTLAHELNQPLAAIVNYSEGSLRRLRADAVTAGGELLEPMTRIAAQARRAAEIVKNIGNFVRRGNIRTEPADINDIINTSVSLIQPEARNAGITISLDLDQGLPPVSVHVFEIEQVILNLLRNGMDALRQGDGGSLRLSVATGLDDDGMVEAAIVDTGRGLPESGIDRIFEPFFTTKQNGMGMGLAISRTIVEAHGGRLSATSNANGGSTFLFTLRRADETHTPASQAERRGGASIAAG